MRLHYKSLLRDETVVYSCTKHWAIFLPAVFWVFCTIVMLTLPAELKLLAFISGIFAIISIIKAVEEYFFHKYILTNKRMLIHEGWFNSNSTEIFLQKIDGFKVAQNIGGKLLGYGSIIIIGAAGSQHQFLLLNNPLAFRHRMQQQVEKVLQQITPTLGNKV